VNAAQHHPAAQEHHPDGHDPHEEPAEEILAPDEPPTPLWLPVLGAVLFFVAFIVIAAL
jgi:hypothetical protein